MSKIPKQDKRGNNYKVLQAWIKEHGAWNKSNNWTVCGVCAKEFHTAPSNKSRFCSRACYYSDMRIRREDNTPRWKGGKPKCIDCGEILASYNSRFCTKHALKENRSYMWKGNQVGYGGLHTWVSKNLGKPDKCEFCKKFGLKGKNIHWANRSGGYKRDLQDWLRLCTSCHKKYDLERLAKEEGIYVSAT